MSELRLNEDTFVNYLKSFDGIIVAVPKSLIDTDGYLQDTSPADFYVIGKKWENEKVVCNLIGYNEEDGCLRGFSASDVSLDKIQLCWFDNYNLYKFSSFPEFCMWYLTRAGYIVTQNKASASVSTHKKVKEIPYSEYQKQQAREELHELNKELTYKTIHDEILKKEIENVYPYLTEAPKKVTRREKYADILKIIDFNTEFILNKVSNDPIKYLSVYDSLQEFLEEEVGE